MAEVYFLSPGCDPTSQRPCHLSVDFSPSCLLTFALSSPSVNGISWGMREATDHRYVSCLCRAMAHSSQRQMPVVPCPSGQGGTRPGVWSKETVLLPGCVFGWQLSRFSLFLLQKNCFSCLGFLPCRGKQGDMGPSSDLSPQGPGFKSCAVPTIPPLESGDAT